MAARSEKHLYLPDKDRSYWLDDSGLPLSYLAWGRRDYSEAAIPASQHDGWCCALIEEGMPALLLSDSENILHPGTLLFIGPDCGFGWRKGRSQESKVALWMWQNLQAESLKRYRFSYAIRSLPQSQLEHFLRLHEQCRQEVLHVDSHSPQYLNGCQLQFEALLARTLSEDSNTAASSSQIDLAISWIASHLDSREPVARLRDYLNVSQSTLYRLFQSCLGQSPATYIHAAKMEAARSLLSQHRPSDLQVKEVAFMLGYTHFNDFCRAFKKYYGISPSETRNRRTGK